jgi:hypothetical protein
MLVLVAHTYNPSYRGSKDQEDRDSRPARTKSKTLSQKKYPKHTKKGLVE